MESGYVHVTSVETDEVTVTRMVHTTLDGHVSRIRMEYLVGTRDGVKHESEMHELGLFTRAEMENAFVSAGLTPRYDPEGLMGRGLYRAVAA